MCSGLLDLSCSPKGGGGVWEGVVVFSQLPERILAWYAKQIKAGCVIITSKKLVLSQITSIINYFSYIFFRFRQLCRDSFFSFPHVGTFR